MKNRFISTKALTSNLVSLALILSHIPSHAVQVNGVERGGAFDRYQSDRKSAVDKVKASMGIESKSSSGLPGTGGMQTGRYENGKAVASVDSAPKASAAGNLTGTAAVDAVKNFATEDGKGVAIGQASEDKGTDKVLVVGKFSKMSEPMQEKICAALQDKANKGDVSAKATLNGIVNQGKDFSISMKVSASEIGSSEGGPIIQVASIKEAQFNNGTIKPVVGNEANIPSFRGVAQDAQFKSDTAKAVNQGNVGTGAPQVDMQNLTVEFDDDGNRSISVPMAAGSALAITASPGTGAGTLGKIQSTTPKPGDAPSDHSVVVKFAPKAEGASKNDTLRPTSITMGPLAAQNPQNLRMVGMMLTDPRNSATSHSDGSITVHSPKGISVGDGIKAMASAKAQMSPESGGLGLNKSDFTISMKTVAQPNGVTTVVPVIKLNDGQSMTFTDRNGNQQEVKSLAYNAQTNNFQVSQPRFIPPTSLADLRSNFMDPTRIASR